MEIKLKITIITFGLSLASLGLNSVQAQENLPCYMINSSGETVDLIDMCQERSDLTEAENQTETPSPDADSQTTSPDGQTTDETETSPTTQPQPQETEPGKPVTNESTYRDNEQLRLDNNGESNYRDNEQLRLDNNSESEMNNP
jgi:hypothetical protein